jgi:hypothetical protein
MRIAQDDSGGGGEKTPPVPVPKLLCPNLISLGGALQLPRGRSGVQIRYTLLREDRGTFLSCGAL